jgi:hypothetical protein
MPHGAISLALCLHTAKHKITKINRRLPSQNICFANLFALPVPFEKTLLQRCDEMIFDLCYFGAILFSGRFFMGTIF